MVRRRPSEIAAQLGMPVWQWTTFMALGLLAKPAFVLVSLVIAVGEPKSPSARMDMAGREPLQARHAGHGFAVGMRGSQLN